MEDTQPVRVVLINHKDCTRYRRLSGKIADFQMDGSDDPGTRPGPGADHQGVQPPPHLRSSIELSCAGFADLSPGKAYVRALV